MASQGNETLSPLAHSICEATNLPSAWRRDQSRLVGLTSQQLRQLVREGLEFYGWHDEEPDKGSRAQRITSYTEVMNHSHWVIGQAQNKMIATVATREEFGGRTFYQRQDDGRLIQVPNPFAIPDPPESSGWGWKGVAIGAAALLVGVGAVLLLDSDQPAAPEMANGEQAVPVQPLNVRRPEGENRSQSEGRRLFEEAMERTRRHLQGSTTPGNFVPTAEFQVSTECPICQEEWDDAFRSKWAYGPCGHALCQTCLYHISFRHRQQRTQMTCYLRCEVKQSLRIRD